MYMHGGAVCISMSWFLLCSAWYPKQIIYLQFNDYYYDITDVIVISITNRSKHCECCLFPKAMILRALGLCYLETMAPCYFQIMQHSYHQTWLFSSMAVSISAKNIFKNGKKTPPRNKMHQTNPDKAHD